MAINEQVKVLFTARKLRLVHPDGEFDKGGRWYPSDVEDCGVIASHRSPSRSWPYSYLTACRSRKHCQTLFEQQPEFFASLLPAAEAALARYEGQES